MYYKKTPAEAVRVAVPAGVFILKYARETAGGRSSALLPDQMIRKNGKEFVISEYRGIKQVLHL